MLVQNAAEAKKFANSFESLPCENFVLLSQTTFSPDEFKKIAEALYEKIPNLQVLDTICPATQSRQKALRDLAKKSDAIIVVGGKKIREFKAAF